MSFSTFLIRSVGAVAVGITAYEINYKSKEHAVYETRKDTAEYLSDIYLKHNTSSNGQIHTEKMKEGYREWAMDNNYIANVQYSKNRALGLGHSILNNIIPMVLGIGAFMAQSDAIKTPYKGFVPKPIAAGFAVVLGVLFASNFVKNVLGWEHSDPPGFYP